MPRFVSPFANRPLAAWIEDLQQSQVADDRYRALLAVTSLGTARDALHWCQQSLNDADSSVRALAAKQLGEQKRNASAAIENDISWTDIETALVSRLHDEDPDVCFEAARSLGTISPHVAEARQVLLSLLDDDGTQPLMIALVVSAVGERKDIDSRELVPRLQKLITHPQAEIRENVTGIIAKRGIVATDLITELIVALDDDEPIVRENAAVSLGLSRTELPEVLAALHSASSDEDEGVAEMAKAALARLSQ